VIETYTTGVEFSEIFAENGRHWDKWPRTVNTLMELVNCAN